MKTSKALGMGALIFAALAARAAAQLDATAITPSVVRIHVAGKWEGSDREIKKVGTGFFIPSDGFVVSAGHVFDARESETDGDVKWEGRPELTIEYMEGEVKKTLPPSESCLLYVDKQTDLALVGTTLRRPGLPLGNGLSLGKNQKITVVAFGIQDRQDPIFVPGQVDSPVSFSRSHGGKVDISAPGLFESDSGSPVLDESGELVGVFVKGRKYSAIGEVAVPISFAAPLLSMAGIAYPPPRSIRDWLTQSEDQQVNEIEAALRELKAEIIRYDYRFPRRGASRDLEAKYHKRLAAGYEPSTIRFTVRLKKGDQAYDQTLVANVDARTSGGSKVGIVTLENFSESLASYLTARKQAGKDSFDFSELREIEITPTATFDFLDGQTLMGVTRRFDWPPIRD